MTIELFGLENIPIVDSSSDISEIIKDAIDKQGCSIEHGDIILIAETLISKSEGTFINVDELVPSEKAIDLAEKSKKDPKLVEAILNESNEVVEVGPNFIITETKHGFVCANAGIDESNVGDGLATPMPIDPDKSAFEIREFLEKEFGEEIAVIITDTQGRAFRFGAIGTAIGCSGISPLWRRVGEKDLYGRELETTEIATGDELAAAASLIMGQADEGLPVVIIRGFDSFDTLRNVDSNMKSIIMPKEFDVFRKWVKFMITVLSGGTGTPKLLQGLKEIVDPEELTIIVNTLENDYFSGVYVSADVDTVLYTMSDMINDELWYGVKGDTFVTNERLNEIGCPELLRIGDIDRATKIQKTQLMEKYGLTKAVEIQAEKMGIKSKIIPMSDENSDIKIITDVGELEFHDFLIKHQSQPEVLDVKFSKVSPASGVVEAIKNSDAVIIGPSNPITSISPILSLDGVKDALKETYVVAVSPIIGSDSVSGPASKFMKALNIEVSSIGVASLYENFLDNIVIDNEDIDKKQQINQIVNKVTITNTIMNNLDAKKNLAQIIIDSIP